MRFLDLRFTVKTPVFTLPPWHGGRWSAWLRTACHMAGISFSDNIAALLPMRSGQKPLLPGESLWLRLLLYDGAIFLLSNLLAALARTRGTGEFSADAFELSAVFDPLSSALIWAEGRFTGQMPAEMKGEAFEEQKKALEGLSEWTLEFAGPLRLPMPAGHGDRGKGCEKYCMPPFMATSAGLAHLLAKVRFGEGEKLEDAGGEGRMPAAREIQLRWEDMRYNRERQIALGGVCGKISYKGRPHPAMARALVLGQYLGAGKNPAFGLGFWRIPELAALSFFPPLQLAAH